MFGLILCENGIETDRFVGEFHSDSGVYHKQTFAEGKDAAFAANNMNQFYKESNMAIRVKVKRLDEDSAESDSDSANNWKNREIERFESGFYSPVPWANEFWFTESEYYNSHFPHISTQFAGKIAFTENEEKGKIDIQLRMRAGKYLTRYFNGVLNESQIKYWASLVNIATGEFSVNIAMTPDEIEHVYLNGPRSCMSHDSRDYSTGGIHPTRVYGAGDLGVAYMYNGDDDSEIVTRCIVWPEKKIYGRIYGDGGEYDNKFRESLEIAGFGDCCDSEFNGAKLLKIESDYGEYVCPYLDIGNRYVSDNGEFLVIGGHDFVADSTDGTCGNGTHCALCAESYNPEYGGTYLEDTGDICESCAMEHTFYCHDCSETYHVRNEHEVNGNSVCSNCISDYPECENCGDHTHIDDSLTTSDCGTICQNCYDYEFFTCDDCDEIFPNNEKHINHDDCCESCGDQRESEESEDSENVNEDENELSMAV